LARRLHDRHSKALFDGKLGREAALRRNRERILEEIKRDLQRPDPLFA
jgi:hypothetical protein